MHASQSPQPSAPPSTACPVQHYTFSSEGTRFVVVTVRLFGGNVVIAVENFYWSCSVSPLFAPSGDWLRTKRFADGNKIDCRSLSSWLEAHWSEITGVSRAA